MTLFKLILIDDEPVALAQFRTLLDWKAFGFELVGTFSDPSLALDYLGKHPVDTIITDIKMPKMSGIDLAKICSQSYPDIKIVLLSAYRNFDYATAALQYDNVLDYILKPLTFQSLEKALVTLYEKLSKSNQITFPNHAVIAKMQQIISNILYGDIDSQRSLEHYCGELGIPQDYLAHPCTLLTIEAKTMEDFRKNKWKYGDTRLNNAIALLVNSTGVHADTYLIRFDQNSIECIILHKTTDKEAQTLSGYKQSLEENFSAILHLGITFTKQKTVSSFGLLLEELREHTIKASDNPSIVERAFSYIQENYQKDISLDDIANYVSLSKIYFCTYYKKHTNESFITTLNRYRIEKAKELLCADDIKISALHEMVGYKSLRYFYKIFKEQTGLTPKEYRLHYKGDQS